MIDDRGPLVKELEEKQRNRTITPHEREMLLALYRGVPADMLQTIDPEDLALAIELVPRARAEKRLMLDREERKAKAYRERTLTHKQQMAAQKAAEKAKKEAMDAEVRKILAATEQDDKRRAAELNEKERQRKIHEGEEKKRIKAEKKVWKEKSAERSLARGDAEKESARRAEASRVARVQTVIGQVNRVLSEGDALYASLKAFSHQKTTDAEKLQLKTALREAARRFAEQADPPAC